MIRQTDLHLDESKLPELLRLVRRRYAGWDSFDHASFVEDEVAYKRKAAEKAQQLLSEAALARLLETADYAEFIRRVRELASATNLLYMAQPSQGDLNLINKPDLDEAGFCRAFFDLLYDDETAVVRLNRFLTFVETQDLTPKWTFPTYYLFLCFPDSEIYVKPMMTRWFVELMNGPHTYPWTASGAAYAAIQSMYRQLLDGLSDYGPRDMIDVHSLVWPAYREAEAEANPTLAEPFASMFADVEEAEWAFDLMADLIERVGGRGPDDPRFALTQAPGYIRLRFGNWLLVDFPNGKVSLSLLEKDVSNPVAANVWGPYKQSKEDVNVYEIPRADLRTPSPDLQQAYERACAYMRQRFKDWKKNPNRKAHLPEIFSAIFDPDLREKLLLEGLSDPAPPQGANEVEGPEENEIEPSIEPPTYDRNAFLNETHLLDADLDDMLAMLDDKRQLIFYGPPGTGKTFVARALARYLTRLAAPPPERVEIIQFHPAYGYEEFIEGLRPESRHTGDGVYQVHYPTRAGAFRAFCDAAARRPDEPHVFIIDEINRGNVARIFGELMLLLEYRNESVRLPYSGDRFRIPNNVTLIGTMNTADRSIALVDFALRRRFHFFRFGADPALLDRWLAHNPVDVPYLSRLYRKLTAEAIDDPAFQIGPSYFMRPGLTERQLRGVWQRSILPYLAEYYVENPSRVARWEWDQPEITAVRGDGGAA